VLDLVNPIGAGRRAIGEGGRQGSIKREGIAPCIQVVGAGSRVAQTGAGRSGVPASGRAFAFKERPRAMARTNRKHRGKFALAAPRVEVVLVPEEQPTSADQVALAAGTLFDAYLVLHVPDGEPPKTIRLDGGPFDKEGAINIILATYSTLTEKYAEAHLKRGETPSAVYDAKIEKN
jgi:hypothetical protein